MHATKTPLTYDGQEVTVHIGRVDIALVRLTHDRYRVVTLDHYGHAMTAWTADFTPERIPGDMSVEDAAREFARGAYRTFHADMQTPAAVTAKQAELRAQLAGTTR